MAKIHDASLLAKALNEFINSHDMPFIEQFCIEHPVSKETLYRLEKDNVDLRDAIKKAITKQEVYLNDQAMHNKINPTFAIFRLKQPQFGYTDKPPEKELQPIKIILDTSGKAKK